MDDVEGKLDILIEMYFEDRQRQLMETDSWRGSQPTIPNGPIGVDTESSSISKSPSIPANLKSVDLRNPSHKKFSLAAELLKKRKASNSSLQLSKPNYDSDTEVDSVDTTAVVHHTRSSYALPDHHSENTW